MSDPRVGSARGNASSPSLSRVGQGTNSASLDTLLATLLPTLVYAIICVIAFFILRKKCPKVCSPRAFLSSLEPHERSPQLPTGWFNWIKPFCQIPDSVVLNHCSLDSFLFLRYLKVLGIIYFVGVCLLWPSLIPLHVTGGGGQLALNSATFGNVKNPLKFYVHAGLAWVYFGFVLYMICRECIYFVNLRQAYLLSPHYANRLSSRTVLFTCVPRQYLDEKRLQYIFGESVKRIWIPRKSNDLDNLVKERRQTALRLEKAEIRLIRMANAARSKAIESAHAVAGKKLSVLSKGHQKNDMDANVTTSSRSSKDDDQDGISPSLDRSDSSKRSEKTDLEAGHRPNLPDVNGSVASQWISHSSRPYHRPIANKGRRVDTIKWTRLRVKKLTLMIKRLRRQQLTTKKSLMPAAFIEFKTQADAQSAYQTLSHHRPLHMSPRYIGVRPYEVIWENMSLSWYESMVRRIGIQAAIIVLIIFWAIPSAIVGSISNIKYLSTKISFLAWTADLPAPVLGLIEGLLPALALSLLMNSVPWILRSLLKISGVPTLSLLELKGQDAYFLFSVIQVFLITTLTSAASAAVAKIIADPTSAESLLAKNLPTASNFYVSYFLIQNLGGLGALVQVSRFFKLHIAGKFSTKHPRRMWHHLHRLQRVHWSRSFPIYSNMAVIALSYCCIAPVVMGFAAAGIWLAYFRYRYNLLYVFDSEISTTGLSYPRALMHTMVGLYFAEVCLAGLFIIRSAFGPFVMTVALLVFTILVHNALVSALGPLLNSLPRNLAVEEEAFRRAAAHPSAVEPLILPDLRADEIVSDFEDEIEEPMDQGTTRGVEGADNAVGTAGEFLKTIFKSKVEENLDVDGIADHLSFWTKWMYPDPTVKPNFFMKWLHPEVYSDYGVLRHMVPPDLPDPKYPEKLERHIYYPPSMVEETPMLWVPRDPAGVSRQEVEHTSKVTPITDEGASFDEKNGLVVDLQAVHYHHKFDPSRLRW